MLYGLGMVILFISCAVESESVLVPIAVALVGITLMMIGRRPADGKTEKVQNLSGR